MSLDFVKVLEETKITPLEKMVNELREKVNVMGDTFEKIVDLVLKMSDQFDEKVSELNNKLLSLEEKIQTANSGSSIQKKIETTSQRLPLPPPPNPSQSETPERKQQETKSNRRAIIDELKEYFKKREIVVSKK